MASCLQLSPRLLWWIRTRPELKDRGSETSGPPEDRTRGVFQTGSPNGYLSHHLHPLHPLPLIRSSILTASSSPSPLILSHSLLMLFILSSSSLHAPHPLLPLQDSDVFILSSPQTSGSSSNILRT